MSEQGLISYKTERGDEIKLSPKIVRQYLVNGNAPVTDSEVMFYLALCKEHRLNPFIRESYLIKFGNTPATMVIAKDVYLKRATRCANYNGHKAGICVLNKDGEYIEREGTIVLPNEILVGGWAEVYMKNLKVVQRHTASLTENSKNQATWKSSPALMIRKVALVQALREMFPEELGGMYVPEEMAVNEDTLPRNNVVVVEEVEENGNDTVAEVVEE